MKVTEKSKKRKGRSTSTGATDLSQAILSLARKLEIPALEKALANYKKAIGTAEESDVHFMTTLLSAASQEKLQEMSEYYRSVNDCMSYRIITPYDAPPYSQDLRKH
ncbi:hypothetical protein GWK47_041764 [Chionoecetes opilio]|uniref:Uncharacterized protein n=1 Tax=Chionoecetes opilio TaxID=41210 RepID=A0A8J4YC55_CHIOP|nr:hypothetical protein GWK47_041764 [Chionoecetes opilio]